MCQKLNQKQIGQILNQHHSEPMTLREIAEIEGVSHQRVAQILNVAIKKFMKLLEERNIQLEDLL